MEWGILMAITEDMTSNTLQQRMIAKKTQTMTLVKILYNWKSSAAVLFRTLLKCLQVVKSSFQPFPSDFEGGLRFLHTGRDYVENEDRGRNFV